MVFDVAEVEGEFFGELVEAVEEAFEEFLDVCDIFGRGDGVEGEEAFGVEGGDLVGVDGCHWDGFWVVGIGFWKREKEVWLVCE